jgi:signal transduction histidine kinase
LALVAIAVFGAIVIALFSYVYLSTASFVRSQSDREIAAEQALLRRTYDRAGRQALIDRIRRRVARQTIAGMRYLLADPSFATVAGNLAAWPPQLRVANGVGSFRTTNGEQNPADAPPLRAMAETLPDGDHLLVGKEIGDLDRFAAKIRMAMLGAVALIFLLAGVASISVTRRTVGRIETINATSRAIMQSGLGRRVPMRGTHDEWDHVAQSLNLMLNRIEALMAEVKQATDNVAHDLRTPLARLRGRLEQAYQRVDRDHQGLIADAIADLDTVLRLFSSLTRISQIEAREQTAAFSPVNLVAIASEVLELYDAAAEEKRACLALSGDQTAYTRGDRDLLFDMLANLVDNAIKHGRIGGYAEIEITNTDHGAVVSVADDGPGIPAGEYANVFKRLYRLDRSRQMPGNGLGLSLVEAVARLHGAQITLSDNDPGLKIALQFPRVDETPETTRAEPAAADDRPARSA